MRKIKNFLNYKKYNLDNTFAKGFTLIELIIVFSVISILSTVGIASFLSYSRTQDLASTSSSFESMLVDAKLRASSQVKPSVCGNYVLSGYQVDILNNVNNTTNQGYRLSVICQGEHALETKVMPVNIKFNLIKTTTTQIFFPILSTNDTGSGIVVIEGYNLSKTISIDGNGNIK